MRRWQDPQIRTYKAEMIERGWLNGSEKVGKKITACESEGNVKKSTHSRAARKAGT